MLNPFVCEVLFRLYCPNRVENPKVFDVFAGGVQMGFVASSQHEGMPIASYRGIELRKNQCDANNAICAAFGLDAKWICEDAIHAMNHFEKESQDFFFTCPPYFQIEKYEDYNGVNPSCANAKKTWNEYIKVIRLGISNACMILKENRFGCIMLGDTRDGKGAYYGTVQEAESILRQNDMKIWQRIIYQEPMALRGITANNSANISRKLANNYQVILVFFKGNPKNISNYFFDLE